MRKLEIFSPQTDSCCSRCGGLLMFVTSEPHPVQVHTDVYRFACTSCDFAVEKLAPSGAGSN